MKQMALKQTQSLFIKLTEQFSLMYMCVAKCISYELLTYG